MEVIIYFKKSRQPNAKQDVPIGIFNLLAENLNGKAKRKFLFMNVLVLLRCEKKYPQILLRKILAFQSNVEHLSKQ
jgi:hypothetical protein